MITKKKQSNSATESVVSQETGVLSTPRSWSSEEIKALVTKDVNDLVKKETELIKRDFVEILGIFAAMLAFVIIGLDISLKSGFRFVEILALLPAFAMSLVFFVISIDYIIKHEKKDNLLLGLIFIMVVILCIIAIIV